MSLANLSPVEVDTIYVERLRILDAAQRLASSAAKRVLQEGGKYVRVSDGHRCGEAYVRKDSPLVAYRSYRAAEVAAYVLDVSTCIREGLVQAAVVEAYRAAQDALVEAADAVQEVDAVYAANPWSRYWLVTSSDGHVHRSCHCHTCNKGKQATGFALVPSLSGRASADAVADLGPALCTACFPEAPVESREQEVVPARLALVLWEKGFEAFQEARTKARADAEKRAADRCPGSGQQGVGDRHFHKCPVCGETSRRTSTGKVRPHARPQWALEQGCGSKWWNGQSWAPRSQRALYDVREAAEAAAVLAGPEARIRRK